MKSKTTVTISKDTLAMLRAVQERLNANGDGVRYNLSAVIRYLCKKEREVSA